MASASRSSITFSQTPDASYQGQIKEFLFDITKRLKTGFKLNDIDTQTILQKYEYSKPPFYTFLEGNFFDPLWTNVAEIFPDCLHPNTITLVAGVPVIICQFLFMCCNCYLGDWNDENVLMEQNFNIVDGGIAHNSSHFEKHLHGGIVHNSTKQIHIPNTTQIDKTFEVPNALSQAGAQIPNWLFLASAISLFWYINGDGLDGKQARRTNTSSVIGHFFDHWMDALLLSAHVEFLFSAVLVDGNGQNGYGSYQALLYLWMGLQTFFCIGQWYESMTARLLTNYNGWFGFIEAQLVLIFVLVVRWFFGPENFMYEHIENYIFEFVALCCITCAAVSLGLILDVARSLNYIFYLKKQVLAATTLENQAHDEEKHQRAALAKLDEMRSTPGNAGEEPLIPNSKTFPEPYKQISPSFLQNACRGDKSEFRIYLMGLLVPLLPIIFYNLVMIFCFNKIDFTQTPTGRILTTIFFIGGFNLCAQNVVWSVAKGDGNNRHWDSISAVLEANFTEDYSEPVRWDAANKWGRVIVKFFPAIILLVLGVISHFLNKYVSESVFLNVPVYLFFGAVMGRFVFWWGYSVVFDIRERMEKPSVSFAREYMPPSIQVI